MKRRSDSLNEERYTLGVGKSETANMARQQILDQFLKATNDKLSSKMKRKYQLSYEENMPTVLLKQCRKPRFQRPPVLEQIESTIDTNTTVNTPMNDKTVGQLRQELFIT